MRCLVTGGCGFVGSALVRRLLAESCEVVVVDDFSRGSPGTSDRTGIRFGWCART